MVVVVVITVISIDGSQGREQVVGKGLAEAMRCASCSFWLGGGTEVRDGGGP